MLIMGIDPGTAVTGIGVIEIKGERKSALNYRVIRTSSKKSLPVRLWEIYQALYAAALETQPDVCAVEDVYGGKNIRTALTLGQARGAAIIAALNAGVEIAEYTPAEVKISLVGNGAASKEQVQYMVKNLLEMTEKPFPLDCSDALAVALCHAHRMKMNSILK